MAAPSGGKRKREFVRQLLESNPRAGSEDVNHAWAAAGNKGSIGQKAISEVQSEVNAAAAPVGPETPGPGPQNGSPAAEVASPARAEFIDELERDLDRILFRVMREGNMPELEHQVRLCRRLLIVGSAG